MPVLLLLLLTPAAGAQESSRPYRLESVSLKQRVIWGAECRLPDGEGLAFGGQDQDADDGRPHTRVLEDGRWRAIHQELRGKNPLQRFQRRIWDLRNEAKNIRARLRFIYFQGLPPAEEAAIFKKEISPLLEELRGNVVSRGGEFAGEGGSPYEKGQIRFALGHLESARTRILSLDEGATPGNLKVLYQVQIHLDQAAGALDAEPPPRAIHCGVPRRRDGAGEPARGLVHDAKTGLFVIFGGDHLDYLTNDTWVFDLAARRWFQRHPPGAPQPRANHRLEVLGGGKIRMTGGYTYTSNTDYCGGQYADLNDGPWIYDIQKNLWTGGELVPADSRVYRTGPFHPHFYLQGERPDSAAFQAWLEKLPANEWVPTDPPHRPRLNRDWGTARLDPHRGLMLRWSGGHSAHGGTDVLHFHLATNRWELPFPVEFPLGQLYSNTSYPNGFNFNRRPWMTGHTYQNYAYDPPSRKMVQAGRPRNFYIYDPGVGEWIGRGKKPPAMVYNSCFYTLTLAATPHGALCWDRNGRVHLFDGGAGRWSELELSGDKLPGAVVDNSTIAYDSKRDRVLVVQKGYGKTPFQGQVYSLDLKTRSVQALSPGGTELAPKFAYIDRCCYDGANDLLLMATYLGDAGDHTPTPAYDCAGNRWVLLDIKYQLERRGGRTTRLFPHGRSCGIVFDEKRRLIWGTDTNSQVYVLRLAYRRMSQ